jgi:hypothetical protein
VVAVYYHWMRVFHTSVILCDLSVGEKEEEEEEVK